MMWTGQKRKRPGRPNDLDYLDDDDQDDYDDDHDDQDDHDDHNPGLQWRAMMWTGQKQKTRSPQWLLLKTNNTKCSMSRYWW